MIDNKHMVISNMIIDYENDYKPSYYERIMSNIRRRILLLTVVTFSFSAVSTLPDLSHNSILYIVLCTPVFHHVCH